MKKLLIISSAITSLAASSQAAITLQIQGDLIQDQLNVGVPLQALYLLIADTNGDGFSGVKSDGSTSIGSPISPGSDDLIVYRGNFTTYGVDGVLFATASNLNTDLIPGWTVGDPLAIMWFPSLTVASTTFITGQRYGFYTNSNAVDGSSAWITPPNTGASASLGFFTKNGAELSPGPSASNPATAGVASQVVAPVPEPSALCFVGLGIAGLVARRRRE
jgi:hypothetical protein